MKVRSHVEVPTLPLLLFQRPLAFLKPSVLEELEQRKKHCDCTRPVLFGRAMPVLGGGGEAARQLGIRCLRTDEIDQ